MAYSGAVQIIPFQSPDSLLTVATSIIDIGTDTKTLNLIVPVPLMVYAFGVYVMESMDATYASTLRLQRATVVDGTDTTISTLDLDSVLLSSGNGTTPNTTASTGSEDIDAGDVVYSSAADFPVLVASPQVLILDFTSGDSIAGELVPFVVARWQGMDLRQASVWMAD